MVFPSRKLFFWNSSFHKTYTSRKFTIFFFCDHNTALPYSITILETHSCGFFFTFLFNVFQSLSILHTHGSLESITLSYGFFYIRCLSIFKTFLIVFANNYLVNVILVISVEMILGFAYLVWTSQRADFNHLRNKNYPQKKNQNFKR